MTIQVDVLIVAEPGDAHADLVETELRRGLHPVARTSLAHWATTTVRWSSHSLDLQLGPRGDPVIGPATTVWWRRPGSFTSPQLTELEQHLAHDETAVMLPGALEAAGVRWVEAPWVTDRASNRLVQLRHARHLGITVPDTVVTNDPAEARAMLATGPVVAKTISTGPGLAPFVDIVDEASCGLVATSPVLLQRAIDARADWRLFLAGEIGIGWTRRRSPADPVDWRRHDPTGCDFAVTPIPAELFEASHSLQRSLGVSMSVQDWLEAPDGWTFLELGIQSQWAFLSDAETLIPPVLGAHLTGHRPR